MTCIVGMIDGPRVWMGADSIEANGAMHADVRVDPKVFRVGPYLLGCSGSWRAIQILRYQFHPVTPRGASLHEFLCTEFLALMNDKLRARGFVPDSTGALPCGDILVGVDGQLFTIYGAAQVAMNPHGFAAVGCGAQVAKGALYGLTDVDCQRPPAKRLEIALRAAAAFQADVRGPFKIEVIGE